MWEKQRIDEEHKIQEKFGLKTLKEVWIAASELRRIRRRVREVLSGKASIEVGNQIIARLVKYSVVNSGATLDDLLIINTDSLLGRRLQTIVFNRGMAKSPKQARQFITHGFIAINGKRVTAPGYMVPGADENKISYYKPIKMETPLVTKTESAKPAEEVKEQPVAQ